MIRPIDTQIIHPQTPIIAGREQKSNQMPLEQQSQFGDLMKKEVAHKKDTVVEAQNPEHLKANKDGEKELADPNNPKSKKEKTKIPTKNKIKKDREIK